MSGSEIAPQLANVPRRLRYTSQARASLRDLSIYLAEASGGSADARRFIAELRSKGRHLASLPGMLGRDRSELRPDLRSFAFRDRVIFFRYVGDDLFEIVDVIDGRRDIDAAFDRK